MMMEKLISSSISCNNGEAERPSEALSSVRVLEKAGLDCYVASVQILFQC